MPQDPSFTRDRVLELDLLHADGAIAGQELILTLQRLVVTDMARAGQDTNQARELLGAMERHLAQLNEWRQHALAKR